ncbi:FAD-dependent thymidylate synthase [Rickettsia endosymbiont of Cardiosporidium cionae]|uniref:FAD-dependent thymidylate synthase n=1 Tax=Rickettsia endosymbiont of Cardiosporidium cionae TaxID=2777155 RepID=UPI0018952F86|nr:FAD-dependent thymidylate synthase [Rickettsia endosymbiont of Cardiosporidium cionae]KAF8818232.1 thymidylate synthase (FAD) [Rickettsia endosymbiont of Cardiosporidium cionae]
MNSGVNNQLFQTSVTRRAVSEDLENILYQKFNILDHGFIRVVDYMGNDEAIVQAARISYGKGTKSHSEDRALIRYLMRHQHTTPFEMCEIKFHIKLPIFVARQWIRHRTANINEYSARYSVLSNEFYIPLAENILSQSSTNKQGRNNKTLPKDLVDKVIEFIKSDSINCHNHYREMMNCDPDGSITDDNNIGISRELARINLTLNHYTEIYWKIDLHNLLHFLLLRADETAQYEIRMYANSIIDVVKLWTPHVYDAFIEYKLKAANLSQTALDVVRKMIKGEFVDRQSVSMGIREWQDLMKILDC